MEHLVTVRLTIGEEGLFDDAYKKFYVPLHKFAYRMCGDMDLAEELVQETFMAAIINMDKLKEYPEKRMKNWLYFVVRNKVKNEHIKSQSRVEKVQIDDYADFLIGDMDVELPPENFKDKLLEILSEEDAELLSWVYEEGYNIREAAERMEISYTACKMRVQRARAKLMSEGYRWEDEDIVALLNKSEENP